MPQWRARQWAETLCQPWAWSAKKKRLGALDMVSRWRRQRKQRTRRRRPNRHNERQTKAESKRFLAVASSQGGNATLGSAASASSLSGATTVGSAAASAPPPALHHEAPVRKWKEERHQQVADGKMPPIRNKTQQPLVERPVF